MNKITPIIFAFLSFAFAKAQTANDLIDSTMATHVAAIDGDWFNPAIWQDTNGNLVNTIPATGAIVHIPQGVEVTYDGSSSAHIFAIRVDGIIHISENNGSQTTSLKVDTFYGSSNSQVNIIANTATAGNIEIILAPFDIESWKINPSQNWNSAALSHFQDGLAVDRVTYNISGKTRFNNMDEVAAAAGTSDETIVTESSRNPYDDGSGVTGRYSWDPAQLSIGLVTMGKLHIEGREKTNMVMLSADANRNNTSLSLMSAPQGWEPGDLLLVTTSGKYGMNQRGEDEVNVGTISGTTVNLASGQQLNKNHQGRPADSNFNTYMNSYVGNLTRNVVIRSEVTGMGLPQIHQRGHVMAMSMNHMHGAGHTTMQNHSDINILNAQFKDLGRTDKSRLADDNIWSNYVAPKTFRSKISSLGQEIAESYRPANSDITNSRGRYSIHLHKTGSKFGDDLAVVKGNVVWGNPGWGITHHDSYADISENVIYDVIGAGLVSETGSETGFWNNNLIAKIEKGHTNSVYTSQLIFNDYLFSGQGLGMKGRAVVCDGNVIANTNEAVGVMNMAANKGATDRVDSKQLATVRPGFEVDQWPLSVNGYSAEGDGVIPTEIPLIINNTTIMDSNLGFKSIERDMGVNHESRSVFDGMIIWGVNQGMTMTYQADYTFHDVFISGKVISGTTIGAYLWKHSHNQVYDGIAFEDLDYAVVPSKMVPNDNGEYKTRNNGFTPWYFIDVKTNRVGNFYEIVDEDDIVDPDYNNHPDNPIHAVSTDFSSRPTTFTPLDSLDLKIDYALGDFKFAIDGIITDDLGAYKLGIKQAAAQGTLREGYPARFYEFASTAKLDEYVQNNGVYLHPTEGYKYFIIDEYLPNRLTAEYKKFPLRIEIENAPNTGVYAAPLQEPISNFLPQNQIISRLPETIVSQSSTQTGITFSFKTFTDPVDVGPQKAVDGNTNGRENTQFLQRGLLPIGSYTQTTVEDKPWYEMDFGSTKTIDFIDIWNTVDMNGNAIESNSTTLNNFRVLISDQPFVSTNGTPMSLSQARAIALYDQLVSYNNVADIPRKVSFNDINIDGRYLRIQSNQNSAVLKLAEVEVVGRGVKPPVDYVYENGSWTPQDPSGISTFQDRAFVINGIAPLMGNMEINELTVNAGSTFDLSSYDFLFTGDVDNSGSINAQDSQVIFYGEENATFSGLLTSLDTLIINGNGTLNVTAPMEIENLLSLKKGTLDVTSGDLVFLSDAMKTAMVDEVEGGTIMGEVTTQRFIPARRAFRFYASPVNTVTSIKDNLQQGVNNTGVNYPTDNIDPLPGFGTHISGSLTGSNGFDATISGNTSLFRFDNTTQVWEAASNTDSDVLNAGEAMRLFVRGDRSINLNDNNSIPTDTRLAPKGELVIGDVTQMLSPSQGNFNFIGNPYLSSVDMGSVLMNSSNLNPNFYYVWDATRGERGAYVTVVLPDGFNTSGSGANQFLQPSQSVFVQTLDDGMSMLRFRESDKNTNQNTSVFSNPNNDASLIARLYRSNAPTNTNLQDSFGIFFNNNFNDGLDSSDAAKLSNQDESIGIAKNNGVYAIERRQMPQNFEVVPLSHQTYRASDYRYEIELDGTAGTFVYFKDNYLNTYQQLILGTNVISFQVDSSIPSSVAENRFELQFSNTVLSLTEEASETLLSVYPNPVKGDVLFIESTILDGQEVDYVISNILGQNVLSGKQKVNGNLLSITGMNNLSAGFYTLSITYKNTTRSIKLVK